MHSAEGFAQGSGDLTQLLMLYRSASLEVIEGMMRYPELEQVADGYTRKKVRSPAHQLLIPLGGDMCLLFREGVD